MRQYRARVRVGGGLIPVTIMARTTYEARSLLEAQYGIGSVATTPTEF